MPPLPTSSCAPAAGRRLARWIWPILLVAAALRFYALNWDQGTLSHPDERHVLMAAHRLGWPASAGEYLDESRSPLNPRNRDTPYFAYGTLPTTLLSAVCHVAGVTRFEQATLVARGLSALADLAVVWLVYLLARRLRGPAPDERTGLLAAGLYAGCVSPIQHAHFFVVDPFANAFVAAALWLLAGVQRRGRAWEYAGVGAALGLAVACKISVATLALPVALTALFRRPGDSRGLFASPGEVTLRGLAFGVAALAAFRLAAPDAFAGWVTLAPRWLGNMREVIAVSQGTVDVPFTRQWVGRAPLVFPWVNMVVWGMGIPLGIAAWAGAVWAAQRVVRAREMALLPLVAWIAVVFLHQGTQWLMTMRYFLPIYAPLIILAAAALVRAADAFPEWRGRWAPAAAVGAATLAWGAAFLGVYQPAHTRVLASRWIYQHVPPGAALGVEHWDDALPLSLPGLPGVETYRFVEFPWYDPDRPAKREAVLAKLDEADYLILASDKLYGSIPRLPGRYPMSALYYRALFDGRLGFDLVGDFRGRMNLLGLQMIATDSAEEAFSVYDHPRVMIFHKGPRYRPAACRALLEAVDLSRVVEPGAAASQPVRPESAILLDPHRWAQQRAGGTWSDIFDRQGLVNRAPVACWAGLLAVLFAVGFPYAFVVFGALPDRGAGLCRLFAIAGPLWLLWLLGSQEWVTFRTGHWQPLMAVLAVGAGAIARRRRADLGAYLRQGWRGLAAGELVFWLAFASCLAIRYANPDLWHANWGGEKPMEMAYLNGVMRSDYFPPYNPWYAGGFINYYYFGFVLTGGLIKMMGVVPEVGFNLCLATFYGLTAGAAFAVTRALTRSARSLWPAAAGAVFVALCGNLFQARFLYARLVQLGHADHELTVPLVSDALRAASGLRRALGGQRLFTYDADPYWVAARAIPVTQPDSIQPITEFPCWSYLYADLHPHLIALPYTLALVGVLAAWARGGGVRVQWALGAAMAFLLGLFWPTNTWDWPTYGALTGITLFLGFWRGAPETPGGFGRAAVKSVALFLLILAAGRLAFLPFYRHYVAGYGSFGWWRGERTPLSAYGIIHGFPLLVIAVAYLARWRRRLGAEGPLRACQAWMLLLRQWLPGGSPALRRGLVRRFERRRLSAALALAILTATVALTVWLIVHRSLPALLGLGFLFSLILAASRGRDPLGALPPVMIALAFGLSLLVEFVVLEGDIGRMNTVFKFYYQVWVLFALGAAASLPEIGRAMKGWRPRWRGAWIAGFSGLLLSTLLYPATAVPAKIADRFVPIPPTLDGLAYMDTARYRIRDREFALRGDLRAIRWLEDHVVGTPVLLEMNTGDVLYSWGSRISVQTGLPSIVGWDWHQRQQQAGIRDPQVARRISDVKAIYSTDSLPEARALLERYGVGLVVVGDLERAFAPEAGVTKFAAMGLERIYDAEGTTIFRVPWARPAVELR